METEGSQWTDNWVARCRGSGVCMWCERHRVVDRREGSSHFSQIPLGAVRGQVEDLTFEYARVLALAC